MTSITPLAVARLRTLMDEPDLTGTRYRLEGRLGEGGMGEVFLVRDTTLDREAALKVVRAGEGSTSNLATRLGIEARLLARLEHPGIVPVHDAGVLPDGRAFYVMKYVRGARLDDWVRAAPGAPGQAPALPARLRLFGKICEAVAWAHAQGIVHRDLKPENVMVGTFGEALVMDWGVGRARETQEGPGRIVIGTPGYMSPEQARGELAAVDERSDIWALGRILDFLLDDGRRAPAMVSILRRAGAERPEERYAAVKDLAEDVERFQDGLPVSAHRENLLERVGRVLRRNRELAWLVAAYLAMRVLLLILAQR